MTSPAVAPPRHPDTTVQTAPAAHTENAGETPQLAGELTTSELADELARQLPRSAAPVAGAHGTGAFPGPGAPQPRGGPAVAPRPGPAASGPIELAFPTVLVEKAHEWERDIAKKRLAHTWLEVIELPPPLFFATVAITASLTPTLSVFARVGPITLRDLRLAVDPWANRYSGTGQLYVPVAFGPRLVVTATLVGSAHLVGLVEVVSIGGSLTATGQAPILAAIPAQVTVIYDHGGLTFSATPQLELGVAFMVDLDAVAYARILSRQVWDKKWHLGHWQWGRAVRMGAKLGLDHDQDGLHPLRVEPFADRVPVEDLIAGMRAPTVGGGVVITRPSDTASDRLKNLLSRPGVDANLILSALADATPAERAQLLADPAVLGTVSGAVGEARWPQALRILRGERSEAVPSLEEGTVFAVERHIRLGRFADALRVVVADLRAHGQILPGLAEFTYVRSVQPASEGLTEGKGLVVDPVTGLQRYTPPHQVSIYDPAFVNASWLYSTVMHEYVHVLQFTTPLSAKALADPDLRGSSEIEAYLWEIEHARGSGLLASKPQMRELGERLTAEFGSISPAGQRRYRARYNAAMTVVRTAVAGLFPVNITGTVAAAREKVQRISRDIRALVSRRVGISTKAAPTPAGQAEMDRIDREVAAKVAERTDALVEVAVADNPSIQVVDRARGIYRYPALDQRGNVRWLFGAITPMLNMGDVPPSAFDLEPGVATPPVPGVVTRMSLGGSGIQGRIQPFPGDIDFVEELDVSAPSRRSAEDAAADAVIAFAAANTSATDRELLRITIFSSGTRKPLQWVWGNAEILDARTDRPRHRRLAASLGASDAGNVNSFWRAWITDRDGRRRMIDITKLLNIHAVNSRTGRDLFTTLTFSELQTVYFDEPTTIPPANVAAYASAMLVEGKKLFALGNFLKASKRIFNYFTAVGDLEAAAAVRPVFATVQADVNRQLAVVEMVVRALGTDATPGRPDNTKRTRILTADDARTLLDSAADEIATRLPASGGIKPQDVADAIRAVARRLRAGQGGLLEPDPGCEHDLELAHKEGKSLMDAGVEDVVKAVFARYVPR
jgi:hypothetical protein